MGWPASLFCPSHFPLIVSGVSNFFMGEPVEPRFDQHQFLRRIRPVSSETKLSWQDFGACQIHVRKQSGERRLLTPEWAVNDKLLRQVIVRFMEKRAMIRRNPHLLIHERLAVAIAFVKRHRPRWQATIDRLCEEFRQSKSPKRRADLQIEIEGLDTTLRTTERNGGADFIAAVVYLYYRAGKDSPGVAEALGIKPPMVRQTLYRLFRCWEELLNPKPQRPRKFFKKIRTPCPLNPKLRTPRPLNPWRRPEMLVRVVELRKEGKLWTEICPMFGFSKAYCGHFIRALKLAGLYVPKPYRTSRERKPRRTTFDYSKARELRAAGLSYGKIAKRLGVTTMSAWNAVNRPRS